MQQQQQMLQKAVSIILANGGNLGQDDDSLCYAFADAAFDDVAAKALVRYVKALRGDAYWDFINAVYANTIVT